MDTGETLEDRKCDSETASRDSEYVEESRLQVACRYIVKGFKIFIAFLFSHIGLTCFVAGYTLLGGIIFQRLELPLEQGIREEAIAVKNSSLERILNFIDSNDISVVLQKSVWHQNVRKILRDHELQLHKLTKENNWDGRFGDETYQWTLANALLYSVTVITTIGYGNIAPKTGWGQVITIVYATFGIPMTMLCLRNIGDLMAGCFRRIYRFACVNMTYQYIKIQRRRMKNRFITRLKHKTHNLKTWAKRKHSEVSTMIHTAIDEHRHGSVDLHKKRDSAGGIRGSVLKSITENADTDEQKADQCKTAEDSAPGKIKPRDKQRRNTIGTIDHVSPNKLPRKHSLVTSKHQSRDSPRDAEIHSDKSTFTGLAVISEDDITVDFGALQDIGITKSDEISRKMSALSLRDFEADEMVLKERLQQTRNLVPVSICLLIMIGYIILGAMIFTPWEENWDFLIGFYFCFITLTTIGFGDFVPGMATSWHNDEKRVFCLGYLLFGMALLAMSFHLIQEEVKHKFRKIAIKIGLVEEKITKFLDSYDK